MSDIKQRKSGIELLKIIAIFLIIISHTTQTLYSQPEYIKEITKPLINISIASTNIKYLLLQLVSYFGSIGNTIFFICSAWFLCNAKDFSKEKIARIFIDVFTISIIYLAIYLFTREELTIGLVVKSFLPNAYGNNWYLSCYMLFCLIYPSINKYLGSIEQKEHLKICIVSCFIYYVVSFVVSGAYFYNGIISFVVLFILISYLNKYCINFCDNRKKNLILLIVGFFGIVFMQIASNVIGLVIPSLSEKIVLRWRTGNNPFLIIAIIGLFNLFRTTTFSSKIINKISSNSLYIYLFHENILFRSLTRVRIEQYLFYVYGIERVFGIIMLFSLFLFIISLLLSVIYKMATSKLLSNIAKKASTLLSVLIDKVTSIVIEKVN